MGRVFPGPPRALRVGRAYLYHVGGRFGVSAVNRRPAFRFADRRDKVLQMQGARKDFRNNSPP